MTEHATHDPAHEPGSAAAHHGHDNSPEAIRKEVRRYLAVLAALGTLTIVTVAISYLTLPTWQAIALGLTVATIKGTLVAAFFMHLVSERKLIFAVLAITAFFFGMLLWGPWHHHYDAEREWPGHDVSASSAAPNPAAAKPHGSSH